MNIKYGVPVQFSSFWTHPGDGLYWASISRSSGIDSERKILGELRVGAYPFTCVRWCFPGTVPHVLSSGLHGGAHPGVWNLACYLSAGRHSDLS